MAVGLPSVPDARRGGGGAGNLAWSGPGINPTGLHFSQLAKHVSPMVGALNVKQTDITVPGRGIDLKVERLSRAPEAFAQSTPWDFETSGR